jgi:3'(2'), 5'-bisphosphate nucleotidase
VPALDIRSCVELMDALTALSVAAAETIRRVRVPGKVRLKRDGSPVTAADEAAEAVIREGLKRLAPEVPVISEEQAEREKPRIGGVNYFLVDPLDGTQEFIAGRDEYTTNIALLADGAPILGVISAPANGLIWRGVVGRGAERLTFSSQDLSSPQTIRTRSHSDDGVVVMVSRSHLDAHTEAYVGRLPRARRVSCGSSIKFCRLAEGTADIYPRLAPTRDWDVAAGHAVLAAAGGSVVDPDGEALVYGRPDLRIPGFIAWGGSAPTEGAATD